MILQLALPQLIQIIFAEDHVLDQLGDFLMEFNHIWLAVDKVLNSGPVLE